MIIPINSDLSVRFLLHIRDLNIVPQLVEHLHEGLVPDAVLLVDQFLVINVTHSTWFVLGNISTAMARTGA